MKIGEAAKRTGLTEKAIRVYVDNGLVHPIVESGIHRNSYEFTEENIRELDQIGILRKAGFSIFEISVINREPERLPELIESKRESLELEAEYRKNIQEALNRLDANEMGDPAKLANALRPAVKNRDSVPDKGSRRWIYVLVSIAGIILTVVYLLNIGFPVGGGRLVRIHADQLTFAVGGICILVSLIAGFMATRYGTSTRRARKFPNRGTGKIVSVLEEHGFDGRFARAGSGGAGAREPGIGGSWQWRFMIWNEIRFDCWFPVVQYTGPEGKLESASFCYGGFRDSFRKGQELEIAWDPKEPWFVYPLEGKWLKQKAWLYGLIALVLLLAGAVMVRVGYRNMLPK